MKGNLYAIAYAAVLGLVSSLLLAAASSKLAPYKEANRKAEEMRNILEVLGIPLPPGASSMELVDLYEKTVRQDQMGELRR